MRAHPLGDEHGLLQRAGQKCCELLATDPP